jgi:hypothetical protein
MRPVRTVLVAAALTLLAAARPAAAMVLEAEPSPVVVRSHAIGLDVGFASAVGAAGFTFTQAFGEAFRLEAGIGAGFSGTQLSLMPKLVLGGARDHFVTGIGVGYTITPTDLTEGNPVWLNVDALGYEHLFQNGLAFSFAVGVTRGLGGGRTCLILCSEDDGDGKEDVRQLMGPQGRVGIAYWF